jgi:hypothetical protein
MSALHGILAEIAEVAGEDAALAIARARGGQGTYFPANPAPDHWLCRLVGADQARAICEKLTGGVVYRQLVVPRGPTGDYARFMAERGGKRAQMDEMIRLQRSEGDIARATGYDVRTVRRRRAQLGKPADNRQIALFD